MTFDSVSEWSFLQSDRHSRVYPYRDYSIDEPITSKALLTSAHSSQRIPPSTSTAWHQLLQDHKAPVTLDRLTYKLRMKSDLNVKTLKDTDLRRHRYPQTTMPIAAERVNPIPALARPYTRQPTALTLTSQTMKSIVDDEEFNGIEGNAVRVGTLDDLIKQFRRAEFQLVQRPNEHINSTSTFFSQNFPTRERLVKQPQAPTEYQIPLPNASQRREVTHHHFDLPLLINRQRPSVNSPLSVPIRQSTAISLADKRLHHDREKQMCVCNKLTIVDPFNSTVEHSEVGLGAGQLISASYIFPPIRSSGYFTKKHVEDAAPPSPPKKRRSKKKKTTTKRPKVLDQSSESLDQLSIDDDDSHIFSETMKSMASLATSEDDLVNPPNTMINSHLDPSAQH